MVEERLQIRVDEKGALVVKRNLEGIGKGAQAAGSGVKLLRTALGGIAAIGFAQVMRSATKTMASFGQEMSTVGAITKANTTQFQEMRDMAKELGTNTRFSATQAAQGMTFLARAGFETNQVLSAIGPTLQLAQAGALDLGRAADIASNVLTGFGIAASDAARVMDVLALAANSANTNVDQLGEAMSYVAPIARLLKVPLEETASAVQALSDAGIQASRAGTNLTMVMRLMTALTPKQAGVLKELGLSTAQVDIANIGLTQSLRNMSDAGISTTQIFKFFGRSAAAAGVLLDGTTGKLDKYTKANEKAEGTAKNIATIMDDNLNGALLAVKSAWEGLILSMGDTGAESGMTKGFQNLAAALRLVASNLEVTTKLVGALGIAIAAVKFAPMLQGVTATVTQFIALRSAAAAGTATMLGSAAADAQKAASALAAAQAEARLTAALAASTAAKRANLVATNSLNVSSQFRINTIKQATVAQASHTVALKSVSAAQAQNAIATKAAAGGMFSFSKVITLVKGGLAALAVNPITIGLLALAAAVAVVTIAFDKFKKLQEEIERIEEATYKMRLKRLQALGNEIREKKAATKALDGYIKGLENENKFARLSAQVQTEQLSLWKAMEIAKRTLSEEEEKAVMAALTEKQAIAALNETLKQEASLLESIKGPAAEYAQQTALLESLKAKGRITVEEYTKALQEMKEAYGEVGTDAVGDYLAGLRQENELLKLNSQEQEVRRAQLAAGASAGAELTEKQALAVRALVEERQAMKASDYMANLMQENELLKLNTVEQEKRRALLAAQSEAGGGLSEEDQQKALSLMAENDALRDQAMLLEQIKGPQEEYNRLHLALDTLLQQKIISLDEYKAKLTELDETMKTTVSKTAGVMDKVWGSVWSNASSALDSFVETGKLDFKSLADSILKSIQKIIAKQMLMMAFKAMGIPVPAFADGGSMRVGGSGGIDSQLVAFKASPNENIEITKPGQQPGGMQAPTVVQSAAPIINVINVVDPSLVGAYMQSDDGEQYVLNVISANTEVINQELAV